MSNITPKERAELSQSAYSGNFDSTKWRELGKRVDSDTGLAIYAVQKVGTNEVVFVARGTDNYYDLEDIPYGNPLIAGEQTIVLSGDAHAIISTATGQFNAQFKEALDFAYNFRQKAIREGVEYEYSVAGHSLGGAISKVIAHTFNLGGVTFDSLVGSNIVESQAYLQHVVQVFKIDPSTLGIKQGYFLNIQESGSIASGFMEAIANAPYLGPVLHVDLTKSPIIGHGIDNFVEQTAEGSLQEVVLSELLKQQVAIFNTIYGDGSTMTSGELSPMFPIVMVQDLLRAINTVEQISGESVPYLSTLKTFAETYINMYPIFPSKDFDADKFMQATHALGAALQDFQGYHISIENIDNHSFNELIDDFDNINADISISSDTTWMEYLRPDEKIGLMVASSDGSGGPSEDTIEHLKKLGLSRMAEQAGHDVNTDNIDKTTGATNYVDPIGDGALNLPEGWEQADYEWIQSVLAGQSGGDSSAIPVQVSDLQDISEEITQALAMEQRAYNSSIVSAGNNAYGIYNAAQSGDGLAMAQNTVNLVTSIDKAVDSYLKLEGVGDGGFLSKDMGEQLGKVGAGLNFAGDLIDLTDSLGSGDALETHNIIDYRMAA